MLLAVLVAFGSIPFTSVGTVQATQVADMTEQYTITVTVTGDGTVSKVTATDFATEEEVVEHPITVNEGDSVALKLIPNAEHQVADLQLDGSSLSPGDCEIGEDGSYVYTIDKISENHELAVEFSQIADGGNGSLADLGISVRNEQGEGLTEVENAYYSTDEIRLSATGKEVRLNSEDTYQVETLLSGEQTILLTEIYMREENPATFGTETKYDVNPDVNLIVDSTSPVLEMAETVIWKAADATGVDISGRATDSNLNRVVYFTSEPADKNEILAGSNVLTPMADGAFVIAGLALDSGVTAETFYFYAIDNLDNCSDVSTVTVHRDETAPEISGISMSPATLNGVHSFGNFHNAAVTFTITAKDVNNANIASGVKRVNVYRGDNEGNAMQTPYGSEVGGVTRGDSDVFISVTIPIGEGGAFSELNNIKFVVADDMGNTSGEYSLTDFTSLGAQTNRLMLESYAPIVAIDLPETVGYQKGNGEHWYKEIPDVTYSVSDRNGEKNGSGLASRVVTLNGMELTAYTKDDYDEVSTYEETVQQLLGENIAASQINAAVESGLVTLQDGANPVAVSFADLAGNTGFDTEVIYLDTTAPAVTGFAIEVVEGEGKLNSFLFGNFANDMVKIHVTVEDLGASSGLDKVTLYLDGEEAISQSIPGDASNKTVTFELPASEALKQKLQNGEVKLYLDAIVSAKVTDHVGNESESADMTTGNSNLKSSNLMIETVKPVVTYTSSEEYCGENGELFSSSDIGVTVIASDVDSGLRSVVIKMNDSVLVTETYESEEDCAKSYTYTVSTADAVASGNNLYELEVIVTDNAGNEYKLPLNLYKDDTAPQIARFDMQAAGNVDADGAELSIAQMDYGYYFREDTRVTVYAIDGTNGASGVKTIHYCWKDETGNIVRTGEGQADDEGKITFFVPAEFKGQIYAYAEDYVGNYPRQENSGEAQYVTPSGVIIETAEQHTREEHISYQRADAPYQDNLGNDLYAGNVDVEVIVTDTFSGIRKVEWSVEAPYDAGANQSGVIEIDNEGNFTEAGSAEGWQCTERDRNLVTELKKTIHVTGNSNGIVVKAKMTDRAGNTSEQQIVFGIDKTAPEIQISFDTTSGTGANGSTYKTDRVATITVKERNFTPEAIVANITNTDGAIPSISGWQIAENTSDPDQTTATATITFTEDGDYTLVVSGKDGVDNAAESVSADEFTIDKTEPVITVSYDTEDALNENYYATERTATIQIEEHNFDPEQVEIIGTATDGDNAISFPAIGGWSSSGDVHTASIVCSADGLYRFDVEYADIAGNEAEKYVGEEFYIDMTEPEIEITGVEDMSANNGDVAPKISLTDTNYDANGVDIQMVGANRGTVTPEGSYTAQGNGQVFNFSNFPMERESDDIYTVDVSLTDLAGNEATDTISFSVNRFGSVYVFDDSLKEIAGTYVQKEIDVKLTEVNVDSLEHDTVKVVVDANGTPKDLVEGVDYTVQESGGNGSWHRYDYTIDKSLFAGDGRYIVTLYSEDVAGNVNENIDESKEAEISFGIDKTAPVVIPIDIESETQYALDVKDATVTVNDNLVLDSVEIYVGEEKCEYVTEGENYSFSVPSATSRQDITIAAVDAAGNRTNYVINGVLVTTNALIRWYNNKPLFIGSLVGVAAVCGGSVGLFFALRSGRITVKRKKK